MKFIIFITSLLSFKGFSQEKSHIVLKTNSLNYLFKTGFNVAAEFKTKQNQSLNFAFEIGDRKINYENLKGEKDKFIVFAIEKRKYLNKSQNEITLAGAFSGPFIKYRYKDKVQPDDAGPFNNAGVFKGHFIGIGYEVGFQTYIFKRISIETKLGLGIQARVAIKGISKLTPILPDGLIGLAFGLKL